MRCLLVLAFALALLNPVVVQADIVVGGIGVPEGETHPISVFTSVAQGSVAPHRQIAGQSTQLREPSFGIYEPNHQLIYISDFRGAAIRVYPAFASGNVAPLRVLNPPDMGVTRAVAPVVAHDELGVILGGCCIYTYAQHASGDAVLPIRRLLWGGNGGGTELNNPTSLVYLPDLDMYAALDYERNPPNARRILFHHRVSQNYDAPAKRITGAGLEHAVGMTFDPATRRIFVLRSIPQGSGTRTIAISVFSDADSGDAVPMHTITSSGITVDGAKYFVGIGFDASTNRLLVSSSHNTPDTPSTNRVVALSANATGETSPIQVLTGETLSPKIVGIPFGVPSSPLALPPLVAIAHPTTIRYGQDSALSSHGGLGNGAVSFAVTQGAASCALPGSRTTVTAIAPGSCTVTVTKAAVGMIPPQTATVELIVIRALQEPLIMNATTDHLAVGESSVLSTSGGSGTGDVMFAVTVGAEYCTLNGNVLTGIARGVCEVYAIKLGDENYEPASTAMLSVTVTQEAVFSDGFETVEE